MNEQIRLLADQAGIRTNLDTAYFEKDIDKWIDYYTVKFAELIIRECVGIANEQIKVAYGLDDRDGWTAAEIKKHFGIES